MALVDFLPVSRQGGDDPAYEDAGGVQAFNDPDLKRAYRTRVRGLQFGGFLRGKRRAFEQSPYDLDRIIKAADTDSYIRQGLSKYRELLWKNGWDITGDNYEAVEYLYRRLDFIQLTMGKSFNELLVELGEELVKFNNAFLVKARGDVAPYFPEPLHPINERGPIAGFYLIPAQTVEIARTKNNQTIAYRQNPDEGMISWGSKELPTWDAKDVIHFAIDRPPGKAFGTPFLVTALDDVIALRQLEEDVQNLVHKELFPLYKYVVGNEENPPSTGEIEAARAELEQMQSDGGVAMPYTHDLDVVGGDHNALDASSYVHYFLIRVCAGLGLSPHHLGIIESGGNRSVTDRLDIALYDRVKSYQRYIAEKIQFHIFNELLLEGGFEPFGHIEGGGTDKCYFRFREIDVDTQIKVEEHHLQLYNSNLLTMSETRAKMGIDPEPDDESQLQAAVMARHEVGAGEGNGGGANNASNRPGAQTPSRGGRKNPPNTTRGTGNKMRPANQHGQRNSPNVRHDIIDSTTVEAANLLSEIEENDDV